MDIIKRYNKIVKRKIKISKKNDLIIGEGYNNFC